MSTDAKMKKSASRDWKNLLIALLDAVAVNAAYLLALLLRFYVDNEFRPTVSYYWSDCLTFAPFYAVICVAVFTGFRLYRGMWRFAGLNDINRIVLASLTTSALHVVGTLLFIRRMPITYYLLGAMFQLIFVTLIRFGYRIFLVEKRMIAKRRSSAENVMIVGAGENALRLMKYLEDDTEHNLRPVCIIDDKHGTSGKTLNGVPVVGGANAVGKALDKYRVANVFIANPLLDNDLRNQLTSICKERELELKDYAGYLMYLEEADSLQGLLQVVKAPTTMKIQGADKRIIPFSPPDISDKEIGEVVEALRSGWITTGPRTKLLERRLAAYVETGRNDIDCNTEENKEKYANRVVCLNSATAAEELNLRILGVREGDEVIVPAYTYTASASAAVHCGAKVVFVDIQKGGDPDTHVPEMDYAKLEAAITERTKAIVAVDLSGAVCDYRKIYEIVERKKHLFKPMDDQSTPLTALGSRIQQAMGRVAVVSDCAHGLGGSRIVNGKRVYCGGLADFTSFSFHAVKNFTTAEGGASTWLPISGVDNAEIYRMFQLLSLHGQNKDALAKTKAGAWEYDIIGPWYKCNMTDIMAAIGLRQLDRYPALLERRTAMMAKYDAACAELGISHINHHTADMDSSNHLYLIRVPGINEEQRNRIIEKMAEKGVATNVHYKPLPMMTAYKSAEVDIKDFPNSYDYYHNLISLPLHTLLSDEDVAYVCETMKAAVREVTGK